MKSISIPMFDLNDALRPIDVQSVLALLKPIHEPKGSHARIPVAS
jgi:hypothetical protein